jgi:hypothetical protein
MSIVRAARKNSFYMLPASVIEDRRLSWAARGLLVYLLSKPDNWRIQITDLRNQTKDAIGGRSGRDKIYKMINELRAAGYIYQEFIREGGNFRGVEYEVSEVPDLEQAAEYLASLDAKAGRAKAAPEQSFTELPETVLPYPSSPFPGKPETIDKTERAFQIEKTIITADLGQAEASGGDDLPAAVTAKAHKPAPGEPANYPQSPTAPSYAPWHAYARAYRAKHNSWPLCNRVALNKMRQLVERVVGLAALTASYYVNHETALHLVNGCHPVGALLANCEGYATRALHADQAKKVHANTLRAVETAPVAAAAQLTVKQAPAKSEQSAAGIAALLASRPGRRAGLQRVGGAQ